MTNSEGYTAILAEQHFDVTVLLRCGIAGMWLGVTKTIDEPSNKPNMAMEYYLSTKAFNKNPSCLQHILWKLNLTEL